MKKLMDRLTPDAQMLMALRIMVDMFRRRGIPDGVKERMEASLEVTKKMNILDIFIEIANDSPNQKDVVYALLISEDDKTDFAKILSDLEIDDQIRH